VIQSHPFHHAGKAPAGGRPVNGQCQCHCPCSVALEWKTVWWWARADMIPKLEKGKDRPSEVVGMGSEPKGWHGDFLGWFLQGWRVRG
jgi:hypothetical protein